MTPIGTKYVPAESLCEHRDGLNYHERYPWPGRDMETLQSALLRRPRRRDWRTPLALLVAVVGALVLTGLAQRP